MGTDDSRRELGLFNMEKSARGAGLYVLLICAIGIGEKSQAAAPVVTDLPREFYIGELETTPRRLYTFVVSGTTAFSCAITISGSPTAAVGNEFEVNQNAVTLEWELWTTGSATFNDAVTSLYTISVVCTDSTPLSSTAKTLTVEVINNEVVSEDMTTVNVDALATDTGDTVATVTSSSSLGHDIVYNMTLHEYFQVDPSSGVITAKKPLETIDSATAAMYLTVTAHDTTDQILVYNIKTLNMINQNTVPSTSSLPRSDVIAEDVAYPTTIFTLVNDDPDTGQTFTYRFTCVPTAGEDIFELSTAGIFRVKNGKNIDYESVTSYTCQFYIDDGIEEGGPFTYTLTLTDVNETPTFAKAMYHGTFTEGTAGSETINPGFVCTDVDAGDTTTFAFSSQNNSDRFNIDPTTGRINFSINYDRDTLPSSVILTVYCVDSGGLSGTPLTGSTQITITVTDINDNAPQFTTTNTVINVDETAAAGSSIGTVQVTDLDSGANGNVTCSAASSSTYASYYSIGFNCDVYLVKAIDFASGTHVQYVVTATDGGSPQLSSTAGLDIFYNRQVTTTLTTTTDYDFFDHGENIAAFVFALLGGLILLGLLSYCVLKYCCGGATGCGDYVSDMCRIRSPKRRPPRRLHESYRRDSPDFPRKERPPSYDRTSKPPRDPYIDRLSNAYSNSRKVYATRPIRPLRVSYPGPPPSLPGYIG